MFLHIHCNSTLEVKVEGPLLSKHNLLFCFKVPSSYRKINSHSGAKIFCQSTAIFHPSVGNLLKVCGRISAVTNKCLQEMKISLCYANSKYRTVIGVVMSILSRMTKRNLLGEPVPTNVS